MGDQDSAIVLFRAVAIGTLRKHDADGNENVNKEKA